jgi:SM-20-related protein
VPIPVRSAVQADAIAAIVEGIAARGYAVTPGFLDVHVIGALRARAWTLERQGLLASAGVGRGSDRSLRTDVRGDRIGWLDEATPDPAYESVQRALEGLRIAVNRELALGLFEFEGHYALYPAGARYARHNDRFRDDDARVLSVILYLNDLWRAADGGALRLFVGERETIDIVPAGGTLVTFLADRFDHEVLPANRPRVSLTGWFRRRA